MNVWFLTVVRNGHVSMTSLVLADNTSVNYATVKAYEEFRESFPSYYVTENDVVFKSSDTVVWESLYLRATLIKA